MCLGLVGELKVKWGRGLVENPGEDCSCSWVLLAASDALVRALGREAARRAGHARGYGLGTREGKLSRLRSAMLSPIGLDDLLGCCIGVGLLVGLQICAELGLQLGQPVGLKFGLSKWA